MPLITLAPDRVINTDHIIMIKTDSYKMAGCIIVMRDDVQITHTESVDDTLKIIVGAL